MFMKNFASLRGIGAALIVVAVFAGPALAAQPTVGDFYIEIANLRGIPADTALAAQTGLVSTGVDLPALDVNKTLTQGDVVDISSRFGLKLHTSRPNDEFSNDDMDGFVSGFSDELGGRAEANAYDPDKNGADPLTKGKGLKKGLWKQVITPSEPV
jgi:hypothetical protein